MKIKQLKILLLACFCLVGLFGKVVAAATYVCAIDNAEINAQHAAGKVVVERQYYSSCSTIKTRYKFDTPSTSGSTFICLPSGAANIPEGYVIVESSNNYPNCDDTNILPVQGYEIKRPSTSSSGETVCDISPIPSGYVVFKKSIADGSTCTSNLGDAAQMKIKIPSVSTSIKTIKCELPAHDVPAGFVITDVDDYSDCKSLNTTSGPGKKITVPSPNSTTIVCQGSIIPGGFAYFSASNYSVCASTGSAPGFKIGPVSGSTATVCGNNNSHVPSGYVVTAISEFGDCEGSYKSLTVEIPSGSGTAACQVGLNPFLVPDGYVISAKGDYPGCDGAAGYSIKIPSGASELICQDSPVPAGWAVTSVGTHPDCAAAGSGVSAVIKPLSGSGPFTICKNQAVPAGFVINEVNDVWSCSNGSWVVVRPSEIPGNETTVCSMTVDQVPTGFVVVEKDNYTNCSYPSGSSFGFRITKPSISGDTLVCQGSVIPENYAITDSGDYSSCGSGASSGPGYIISLLTGPGPYTVCDFDSIPEGYVITSVEPNSYCGTGYVVRLPSALGNTSVCSNSTVPSGYVIVEKFNSASCPFSQGWNIAYPNENSTTLVCDGSVIPNGYVKATYGQRDYASCGYTGSGPGYLIIPEESDQATVPSTFINTESDVPSKPADPVVTCNVGAINGGLLGTANANSVGCN